MKKGAVLMSALLFWGGFLNAQDIKPGFDRKATLQEALEWQILDSANEALEVYERIPFNDSAYVFAALERSVLLLGLDRAEEAIEAVEQGLEMPEEEYTYRLCINKGVALTALERYDEALAYWDSTRARYPNATRMTYHKAMTYRAMEEDQKAFDHYKAAFLDRPYSADVHLMLGTYAAVEGKIAQALMCYDMFLVMENYSQRAFDILYYANEIVSRKIEEEAKGVVLSETGDDFDEIDLVLMNFVALQKGYKAKPTVDLPFVKQNHLMLEMLNDREDDGGFWSTHYVPFYQEVWRSGAFEGFMYQCLVPSQSKVHQKMVTKNASQIDRFNSIVSNWIAENWTTKTTSVCDVEDDYRYWFNDDDELEAIGNLDPSTGSLDGPFHFYWSNGHLKKAGNYDQGELVGDWKTYYSNGDLHETVELKNSEIDGRYEVFSTKGFMTESGDYEAGTEVGEHKEFYGCGALSSVENYTDGKLDGPYLDYFVNGKLSTEATYSDGLLEGEGKSYYRDGQLEISSQFKEDKKTGTATEYHQDGSVRSVYEYTDGKTNGPFKEYYDNGQIEGEGTMKEGSIVEKYTAYYRDGIVERVVNYDEEGKKNGVIQKMDQDGKLWSEFEYKKDDIVAYKYFNKKGEVIEQAQKKGGEFMVNGHFPTGELHTVGLYEYGGGKTGEWKWYYMDGTLSSVETYEDNQIVGVSKNYYENGELSWLAEYEDGALNGYYASFDELGTLKEERWYENGLIMGEVFIYYPDGTLSSVNYYEYGELEGRQTYFAVNGKLRSHEEYSLGFRIGNTRYDSTGAVIVRHDMLNSTGPMDIPYSDGTPRFTGVMENGWDQGEFKWYYPDGSVESSVSYQDDQRHGRALSYFENGKKASDNNYVYGERDGLSMGYFENGKVRSEWTYVKGQANGLQKSFHKNGNKYAEREYLWGESHGPTVFYDQTGETELIRYYDHGRLYGFSYLGADGDPVDTIPVEAETGMVESFFANGNKARQMEFRNDQVVGEFKKHHKNGNVRVESIMVNGEENGIETTYYSNGKVESKENYINGTLDGTCEYFYENGKPKEVLQYMNGSLHGKCRYYDAATGKVKIKEYYDGTMLK